MNWNTPPRERTADQAGFSEHVLDLLSSALGYLQARLELAGIEGREALATYGMGVALLAAAAVLLLFGYVFLWIGIIAVIATFSGVFWGWVVLAVAILHFIGALGLALAARAKWGRPVFPVTLQELRKDQEWLTKPGQTVNPN